MQYHEQCALAARKEEQTLRWAGEAPATQPVAVREIVAQLTESSYTLARVTDIQAELGALRAEVEKLSAQIYALPPATAPIAMFSQLGTVKGSISGLLQDMSYLHRWVARQDYAASLKVAV